MAPCELQRRSRCKVPKVRDLYGFITDSTNGPMDAKGYGGFDRSCLITMIESGKKNQGSHSTMLCLCVHKRATVLVL